ncbi:MAG: hypothetical protein ACI4IQ_04710 [Eubacterium sp.]
MGQEWNWQIDDLKNQEAYNASQIEDAIRSQTEAINRANEHNSSVSGSHIKITDIIPKEKIPKVIKTIVLTLLGIDVAAWIICGIIFLLYKLGVIPF